MQLIPLWFIAGSFIGAAAVWIWTIWKPFDVIQNGNPTETPMSPPPHKIKVSQALTITVPGAVENAICNVYQSTTTPSSCSPDDSGGKVMYRDDPGQNTWSATFMDNVPNPPHFAMVWVWWYDPTGPGPYVYIPLPPLQSANFNP
jgi:hypothetical protein